MKQLCKEHSQRVLLIAESLQSLLSGAGGSAALQRHQAGQRCSSAQPCVLYVGEGPLLPCLLSC
jgi:hypothetical protein